MIQIKKTILTLALLMTAATGAWAQTETLLTTITATGQTTYSETTSGVVTVTHDNNDFDVDFGWLWESQGSMTVEAKDGYTITKCVFNQPFDKTVTVSTAPFKVNIIYNEEYKAYICEGSNPDEGTMDGVLSIEVYGYAPAAPSGPKVAWDKDKKTGTFTMPGGNVTLEPEYYPQATVADGGVTAADADARATTDDPLVKVDATKLTGAKKLMYFVSNSGTTAPAYDAEGWTDQLPTAEGFTQQGIVYVWYYPVGTDEGVDGATATYSDGDICLQSITARIAPEPTYAVTFAEGTEESDKWKAIPNTGVTKGETVTVTYTGSKKVIGVKAEKKAAAPAGPITVTWNGADITGSGNSFTKDGVTITAGDIEFMDKNFLNGGTFTTTLGNFTKIEVTTDGWYASGTGWSGSTWTGNASSVSFSGEIMGYGGDNLKFVFTIEPTN